MLGACATPSVDAVATRPEALVGSAWLARELAPANAPLRAVPRLQFLSPTQLGGSGGCNGFGGPVKVEAGQWQIGPLASTRKLCLGPEMDVEKQFFARIERVRAARLADGRLELQDAAGAVVLRLTRAE